ncbi:unnamed protein product [Periconia digitata]|uniref:Alcohol acetyltransferase n=1 Tax=Periconia digitata TaxID=1303443 RepID=A0A9W4U4T9_9PLEO|nr:unnamed protein product [Periconia digitata]
MVIPVQEVGRVYRQGDGGGEHINGSPNRASSQGECLQRPSSIPSLRTKPSISVLLTTGATHFSFISASKMANKDKSGKDQAVVLRKFGINETYQLAMYLLDQYRSTVLSCRYVLPPRLAAESRSQIEKVIKAAVVDTVLRHPMMQVGMIDGTSKTPSWIQLPSLDLAQLIHWVYLDGATDGKDFDQTVQDTFGLQLDERFPDLDTWATLPGWKLTIIRQADAPTLEVMLAFNHPQFDGAGAKVWHEDFFDALNAASANKGTYERVGLDGDILTLPDEPPMLPAPLETLRSLPLDPKFFIKSLWEEFRPQFLNRFSRDATLASWCPIRDTPYKTQFRAFFLDNASLSALLAVCRKNKTTITGLLQGLSLVAFSLRLDAKSAPGFQSSTVVDHRRNLPDAPPNAPWGSSSKAVGNFVTQLLHRFETEAVSRIRSKLPPACDGSTSIDLSAELQDELWAVCAQNRREIAAKVQDGLRNDVVGLFQYVTDWKKTMSDMASRTRQFSWLVTNVGVLDGAASPEHAAPDDEGWRWSMERAQFGLSAEIPAAAIEISPVSVKGKGMCVGADWPDNAVDAAFGLRIMEDLERWMRQLAALPL